MPKVAKELKDIDLRRKTYRTDASGKTGVAFYSVGGVSGLQLRCAPPKGAGKKNDQSLGSCHVWNIPFFHLSLRVRIEHFLVI